MSCYLPQHQPPRHTRRPFSTMCPRTPNNSVAQCRKCPAPQPSPKVSCFLMPPPIAAGTEPSASRVEAIVVGTAAGGVPRSKMHARRSERETFHQPEDEHGEEAAAGRHIFPARGRRGSESFSSLLFVIKTNGLFKSYLWCSFISMGSAKASPLLLQRNENDEELVRNQTDN